MTQLPSTDGLMSLPVALVLRAIVSSPQLKSPGLLLLILIVTLLQKGNSANSFPEFSEHSLSNRFQGNYLSLFKRRKCLYFV